MNTPLKLIALFCVAGSLILMNGCSTSNTDSNNIKTSGIYAVYKVTKTIPSEIKADAFLTVGNELGTEVELSNGEQINCNNVNLVRIFDLLDYIYTAKFSTDASSFTFNLIRNGEATVSTAAPPMPDPPNNLFVPDDNTAGQDITVKWQSSNVPGAQVALTIDSPYMKRPLANFPVDDTGTYTYRTTEPALNVKNDRYDLTVSVARSTNKVPVNSALSGGTIQSTIVATKTVKYVVNNP